MWIWCCLNKCPKYRALEYRNIPHARDLHWLRGLGHDSKTDNALHLRMNFSLHCLIVLEFATTPPT